MAAALDAGGQAIERHEGNTGWFRSGGYFDVDVSEYDPPDPIEDQFGFAPTVEIYFEIKKFADFDAQETDVLGLSLGVLDRIPGDALLNYQFIELWMLRKDGKLTINDELWKPKYRALIKQPYESGPLSW
nr:hypothetical protein [Kibdelosporangium sp. MJ126-NF4]